MSFNFLKRVAKINSRKKSRENKFQKRVAKINSRKKSRENKVTKKRSGRKGRDNKVVEKSVKKVAEIVYCLRFKKFLVVKKSLNYFTINRQYREHFTYKKI
jgi:hypothetical protein